MRKYYVYNQLLKFGFSKLASSLTCDVLYFSEINNKESHGFRLLKSIKSLVANCVLSTNLKLERTILPNGIVEINCNNSIGYASASVACRYGIVLAKKYGLSVIALNNIDHIGALKYYTYIMAKRDCIGFITVNGKPRISLHGTITPHMGTTPISIGIPTESQALAVDLCLAQKSINEIIQSETHIDHIGIDNLGKPSNISKDVLNGGSIFPIGDKKGAALSFAIKLVLDGLITCSSKGNHPVLMIIANANSIEGFKKRSNDSLEKAVEIIKSNINSRLPGAINNDRE